MDRTLPQLADELAADQAALERELAEIELLLRQATSETERHEARRIQAEERVSTLERDDPSAPELPEARSTLITQTRRVAVMQTQLEVLGGKQRALQRFRDRLAEIVPIVREAPPGNAVAEAVAPKANPGDDLAAQEELRRDIARQMHDGPAQSIANIALQAHVVQRLFERQPKQAQAELAELVRMVELALAATKEFIFDVRPMVLDDLGLVPTLRRSSLERARRTGIAVRFDSVGADRRLTSDLESALFRIIDDAMSGYLSGSPAALAVRLDWTPDGVGATVQASTAAATQSAATRAHAVVTAARNERTMPAALASMIREQERDDTLRATGLPEAAWNDIQMRADVAGMKVRLSPDRSTLEVLAAA
ncbi:MAG: two-component system, NarL family, sensor histidine kinase DegS [Chloroflexota bacterium]|jgi:two-component system sensor histidine kinase DegS|nr:two-component system, NarL family, sensor histidine kinase DegS [Chloroflexota bacterium]